jgi:hypothetical protein
MKKVHHGPLDDLARHLVVPAKSGIYLAKSEIIVLANLAEGSLRVNERARMLADVLKSPDNLVDLAALIQRLIDFTQLHIDRADAMVEAWPAMAGPTADRRAKATKTREMLEDMHQELLDEAEDAGLL